jgi:hypothetical protein
MNPTSNRKTAQSSHSHMMAQPEQPQLELHKTAQPERPQPELHKTALPSRNHTMLLKNSCYSCSRSSGAGTAPNRR